MEPLYGDTIRVIEECTELVILAIAKKTCPVKDDLSEHQAYELYGRKWLKTRVAWKVIARHRIGNRIIYSRHEIECVKAAEKDYSADFDRIYRQNEGGE